ncbi:hypothetical protein MLD38_037095 [Melastoma candidum]|uniref:Uncharacterized protein n=1 Tax=Melastoma candidum TaxID=119954 RepID=A0ACB9LL98_9MYRT|nr:hypothetical protein MLD38_037095 [Melastoma candidum]
MEERKLNLYTPLLSVRRNLSSASTNASSLRKERTDDTSTPRNQRKIFFSRHVGRRMDQVTKPVSVPFTWEEVPGKAKDEGEPENHLPEDSVSNVPMIVARNCSSIHDDSLEEELRERSQSEKGLVSDDDERYSDAVDTLSPTASFSVSNSVSSLGESDGTVMKPSGTFSIDRKTRDFIMGRFLPAARAMAIASESSPSLRYASREPPLLLTEQPKEVEKLRFLAESGTPSRQHHMAVVKYCTQALSETESSEEEEEEEEERGNDNRNEYGATTDKGCGLLPQLYLANSLRLFNPVPVLKSKIKNSMPFVPAIRKDAKVESASAFKGGGPLPKSEHWVETFKSETGQIKSPGTLNRRSFSGELQKIGRLSPFRSRRSNIPNSERRESPQPSHTVPPPLAGLRRLSLSGELQPTRKVSPFRSSRNDVAAMPEKHESPRLPHGVPSIGGYRRLNLSGELGTTSKILPSKHASNYHVSSEKERSPRSSCIVPPLGRKSQYNFSGELRTASRLSPFRPSRNDVVTAERRDLSPLSCTVLPPGESSSQKMSRLSPYRPQRNDVANPEKVESPRPRYVAPPLGRLSQHNFSGELRMVGRLSPSMPSRDDTLASKEESSQASYSVPPLGWPGRRNLSGEMQIQRRQSPLRPQRNYGMAMQREEKIDVPTLNKTSRCIRPASPAFERTLYVDTENEGRNSCSNLNMLDHDEVWVDSVASRDIEETSTGKSSFQDIECLNITNPDQSTNEIIKGVVNSLPLPLPSLKAPSESWLWHALPNKQDHSLLSSLRKTTPSKKHVSDAHTVNSKWETIVKTSKTHHDHTRYSEELIQHVPQQFKS